MKIEFIEFLGFCLVCLLCATNTLVLMSRRDRARRAINSLPNFTRAEWMAMTGEKQAYWINKAQELRRGIK